MKKNLKKSFAALGGVAVGVLAFVEPSLAQGIVGLTANANSQFGGITDLLIGGAYVGGVGFGVQSALKFKEYNQTKGQTPLSQPVTSAIVAAILLSLPTFLSTGKQTVFGAGAGSTALGTQVRTIN